MFRCFGPGRTEPGQGSSHNLSIALRIFTHALIARSGIVYKELFLTGLNYSLVVSSCERLHRPKWRLHWSFQSEILRIVLMMARVTSHYCHPRRWTEIIEDTWPLEWCHHHGSGPSSVTSTCSPPCCYSATGSCQSSACPWSWSQWSPCPPSSRRRAALSRRRTPSSGRAASATACRTWWAGWGSEFCSTPPAHTETSPEDSRWLAMTSVRQRLKILEFN